MKTYYRIKRNGTLMGDYEYLAEATARAESLEQAPIPSWKGDETYYYAFGRVINGYRTEYEIEQVRKRA